MYVFNFKQTTNESENNKMSNSETEDETLKFFQKMNDENWVSDTELFEKSYELNKNKENCEKMTIVRANKKVPMSGMKKPKGIKEWL